MEAEAFSMMLQSHEVRLQRVETLCSEVKAATQSLNTKVEAVAAQMETQFVHMSKTLDQIGETIDKTTAAIAASTKSLTDSMAANTKRFDDSMAPVREKLESHDKKLLVMNVEARFPKKLKAGLWAMVIGAVPLMLVEIVHLLSGTGH